MNTQVIQISPECLEVANLYLTTGSLHTAASKCGLDLYEAAEIIGRREVKAYLDAIYLDAGYRNRFRLADALDTLIDKKLKELEEADIGSSKDIAELLALAHKMRMDEITAMAKLEESRSKPHNQTNIQINDHGNYTSLVEQIMKAGK